jgi:hypothetical protein
MAARLRAKHQDDIRRKIQAGNLINRLEKHISGKIDLSPTQLRSIEILLDRSLAKLSALEISGPDGGPLTVEVVRFADTVARK